MVYNLFTQISIHITTDNYSCVVVVVVVVVVVACVTA